jgi:hypothetical protein
MREVKIVGFSHCEQNLMGNLAQNTFEIGIESAAIP